MSQTSNSPDQSVRGRLVAAANQLWEREPGSVSLELAAELAGIARSTAYRHISGREELLLELAQVRSVRILDHATSIVAASDRAGVAARLEAVLAYLGDELPGDPVLVAFLADGPQSLDLPAVANAAWEFLGGMVTAGQDAGELRRDVSAVELVRWVLGHLVGHATASNPDVDRYRFELRTFVIPSVAASVAAPVATQATATDIAMQLKTLATQIERL